MKKFYLFLTAMLTLLTVGTTKALADIEPIRVDLNVDNMTWEGWNKNDDPTYAWGKSLVSFGSPKITIKHTNNNMKFWNGNDLQFYALVGTAHPQNYYIAVESGFKILEVGCDFISDKHPSGGTAEYGVQVSINGEEYVQCFSTTEFVHAEATDISAFEDVTSVALAVDFVPNEALGDGVNMVFANTKGLYIIVEPLTENAKALSELSNAFSQYEPIMYDFVPGTEPGTYPEELVNAFAEAVAAADVDADPDLLEASVEELQARLNTLESAYEALVAAKHQLVLADGFYRIRTSLEYSNEVPTGEVDANGQDITETVTGYKYIRNVIGNEQITSRWQSRNGDAFDEGLMLFSVTNKDGFIDLVNVATETRFSDISASGNIVSSKEADGLIFVDAYETADDETSVFIRMAAKKDENNSLHQSGHASGAGVSGNLVGWYAFVETEAQRPSLWVFEAVSPEEVQEIMAAYIPAKEREEMLADYHRIYTDAETKIEVAKDPIVSENGLITEAEQLYSPNTSTAEGSIEALIDNNSSTYWHSDYSVHPGLHVHYLQVALHEGGYGELQLSMTRRNGAGNDHITQWGVFGSNDPEAADEDWVELASLNMPYASNTETKTARFDSQGYQYLRFYIDRTTGAETRGFGHCSEFQLFEVSENPNSQYAKLGDIAVALENLVQAQAGITDAEITTEIYEALKQAYDAFTAQIVDPSELRQLLAELEGKTDIIRVGTQPGFWKDNSTAAAFDAAYDAAKAYNEAGVYTRAESDHHVATLNELAATITDAAIGIKTGKWYRFRFGTEAEYEANGWNAEPASASTIEATGDVLYEGLLGKYITVADVESETVNYTEDVTDDEGNTTQEDKTATKYTVYGELNADEIALGQGLAVDAEEDIVNKDFSLFRFVAVGDTAYIIQNKATGLFIKAAGTSGAVTLSVHPTLFNVSAMGYGANLIKAKTITGVANSYLHVQTRGNFVVTWNATDPGTNSSLYIEEDEDVADNYDGSEFRISVKPGAVQTYCFPVAVSGPGMWGINRIEGNELELAALTEGAAAGRPFIYINGDPEDYNAGDDDAEFITFRHGYEVNPTADETGLLRGTYDRKELERGDVVAQANAFVIIKDVMFGGIIDANQAYISKDNDFTISEAVTINLTTEEDGIAAAIADVAKNGVIYTIDGRVAANGNINTVSRLPKGIYILNGRKLTVK